MDSRTAFSSSYAYPLYEQWSVIIATVQWIVTLFKDLWEVYVRGNQAPYLRLHIIGMDILSITEAIGIPMSCNMWDVISFISDRFISSQY